MLQSSIIRQMVPNALPPCRTAPAHVRLARALWLWLLLGNVLPTHVKAEDAYTEAIERAVAAYNRGDYEEATREFERAHERSPSSRTLRGIGMSEFELGHYDRAATALKQALASKVAALEGNLRKETERLHGEALARVGQIRLELEPEGSQVALDGALKSLDDARVLVVTPGAHTLEVSAPGYDRARQPITAEAGHVFDLKLTLVPLKSSKDSTSERRNWYKSPWLWTTVGVVVVSGAVVGGLALSGRLDKDDAAPEAGNSGFTLELPPLLTKP